MTSIGNLAFAYCNNLKLSIGTETVGTWFKGLSNLTSVTFKNSVKTIADNAFYGCSGLSSIVIPNSVTSIGNDAFSGCDEITTLNIGMSEIGTWFRGLRKLASVTMTYGVKHIDDYAFSGCHIKNLTIPRSVTGIGSAAFSGVDTLTIGMSRIETWFKGKSWLSTLVLTSSVETIEPEAFSGCKDLNNVKMYNGVTSIGTKAFYNCRSLTSVILSNNLKTIEDEAFSSCTSLSEIKIPYSVNEIGINAFNDSGIETITVDMKNVYWDFGYIDKLHTVIFTKNVESIDDGRYGPFQKCRNIERIVVEDGNKYYDSRNNCNALIGTNSNTLIFGCKNTIIPSGVTRIGDYAFYYCSGLVNINIPEGVTSIGEGAFYYCSGLVNINVPEGVTTIGSYAFQGSKLTSLLIPSSVTDIGYEVFSYCHSLRSLTFLGNIPNIRLGSEIVSLTLGPNVKSINKSFNVKKAIWLTNTPPTGYEKVTADVNYVANNQYTSLKNVIVYPFISSMFEVNGVKYVPVSPSEKTCDAIDCNYSQQVDSVNVGNSVLYKGVSMSVKQVCPYTFYANSFVKQVGLNYSGNIGSYALSECLALENVNIEIDGNVGRYAFYKSKLMKLEIARASKIDEYAFGSVTNNFNAQINNNDDICANAFYQSTGLDSLFIGGNVNTIGDNAFNGCSSMRSVALSNVKTFGNNSFEGCSSLEKVVISDSTKLIGPYAFKGCSSLRELSIGSSVESIGTYAFSGCPELLKVEIPASVGIIDNYAFAGCEKINTIIFDDGTEPLVLGSNGSSPLFADCPLDTVYIGRNISYDATSAKGYSPFYRNTSLRAVEITDKETEISENEFYGCSKLKNVRIGDGVTTIGNWAFSGCASLDYFAFGRKVKNIGHESFSDCTNVTHLISRAPVPPTCGSQALDDINKWSCTLTVPKACLKSYQAADQWKEFFFMEEGFALEHTVTYIDGDSIVAKEIMSYGDSITAPVLNKDGYTFVGWSPKVPEVLGDDDLSFTAQWELNKYMLTYIVDGDTVKSDSIVYASALTMIDEPTKEGYTFSGWSELPQTMPAQDVVVTGTFTINSYLLTYKVDGEIVKSDSIVYNTALTLIDEPTKEGYTFSGWSELPQTMPAKDVVVTGTFSINSYLLTYMVDGDTVKSDSIVYNTALTLIDEPMKDGYTFSGWSELPQTMPAKDVVVTGTFTINSYLLTYKVDGETVKSDSIAYGTALTLIDAPTKEGYTFSGWSELPQTMPAKDVVVTGTFTINSYQLTYTVDGETYKTETVDYGTALTLIDAPTKEGYTFSGWSELPQTMPAKDVVVTGTFTINSYQLTYTVDGETYKTETVVYGTALTLIDAPTKEGYTFSGWSELPQTMPAKDVVVTGTFTINCYVVTFKADGKVVKSETLTYGAAITAPEDPTKEGYTFVGWNPEVDATVPANDVTYEAVYQVNVYAVIYMVNDKEWARDSVAYGETIVLKQYTPAEGETFNSWTSDQEYTTMPAHDVVYTANITTGIWSVMANREFVDVYNLQGGVVARRMPVKDLKKRLPRGVYIIEGRKVAIK